MTDILQTLSTHWQQFTWLRPEWLWAMLPLLLLAYFSMRNRSQVSGWQQLIAPELLASLTQQLSKQRSQSVRWGWLGLAWLLCAVALAGPSFSRQELNTLKLSDALVIVLDLSPSMLAEDIKPSRLQAAHFKILDLLKLRAEGYTALIAYSGSAHVVAPLSDDANTLAALVSSLHPSIMPKLGSQAEDAINEALSLLKNANFTGGRIVLFTDDVVSSAQQTIQTALAEHPEYQFAIVGVGTEQGAPMPMADGQFARNERGQVAMFGLPWNDLTQFANKTNAEVFHIQRDAQAIEALAEADLAISQHEKNDSVIDLPQDHGFWLLPLIVLFTALAFLRRDYLLPSAVIVLALCLATPSSVVYANEADQASPAQPSTTSNAEQSTLWRDLWLTPDQQASRALAAGDADTAYQRFEDPQWKATAAYESGRYAEAETLFQQDSSPQGLYNLANAQAQQGKLSEAIANYERALTANPDLEDAKANKALLEELLKAQQQEQQQSDANGGEQSQPQQSQQQQSGEDSQNNESSQSTEQQDQQNDSEADQQQSESNNAADNNSSTKQSASDQAQPDNEQQASEQNFTEQSDSDPQSAEEQQAADDQAIAERAARAAEQTPEDTAGETPEQAPQGTAQPVNSSDDQPATPSEAVDIAVDEPQDTAMDESQQALEQQLRRVPDDPAGLLRNKFNYYYQLDMRQRRIQGQPQEQQRW